MYISILVPWLVIIIAHFGHVLNSPSNQILRSYKIIVFIFLFHHTNHPLIAKVKSYFMKYNNYFYVQSIIIKFW